MVLYMNLLSLIILEIFLSISDFLFSIFFRFEDVPSVLRKTIYTVDCFFNLHVT